MDWQLSDSKTAQTDGPLDADMAEEGDAMAPSSFDLRPAVFNPSDDNWHDASMSTIRGLEKLFQEGVTLQDLRTGAGGKGDGKGSWSSSFFGAFRRQ